MRKHTAAARWFHWINVPLLALMTWSGLWIYWANDVYRIGAGQRTLFRFFPNGFYEALGLDHRLAQGMAWHFFFGWLFTINGIAYVLWTIASGQWRALLPRRGDLREAARVTKHDLTHLRAFTSPHEKYNAAQRIAYSMIVLMGALSVLSGLAIYRPVQLAWLARLFGGYQWARWVHFWLMMGYVAFFIVHIIQVIRAGWQNFRSIVSGHEIVDKAAARGVAETATAPTAAEAAHV